MLCIANLLSARLRAEDRGVGDGGLLRLVDRVGAEQLALRRLRLHPLLSGARALARHLIASAPRRRRRRRAQQ